MLMRSDMLTLATRNGLESLGTTLVRLAALAESVHRADTDRTATNHLSLLREDRHEAHGGASRPVTSPSEVGAGLQHTEVLQ